MHIFTKTPSAKKISNYKSNQITHTKNNKPISHARACSHYRPSAPI